MISSWMIVLRYHRKHIKKAKGGGGGGYLRQKHTYVYWKQAVSYIACFKSQKGPPQQQQGMDGVQDAQKNLLVVRLAILLFVGHLDITDVIFFLPAASRLKTLVRFFNSTKTITISIACANVIDTVDNIAFLYKYIQSGLKINETMWPKPHNELLCMLESAGMINSGKREIVQRNNSWLFLQ